MTRKLRRGGQGLFVAGFAAALGFGASQAFAGVTESRPRNWCTERCVARYNACVRYNGQNCIEEQRACFEICANGS